MSVRQITQCSPTPDAGLEQEMALLSTIFWSWLERGKHQLAAGPGWSSLHLPTAQADHMLIDHYSPGFLMKMLNALCLFLWNENEVWNTDIFGKMKFLFLARNCPGRGSTPH